MPHQDNTPTGSLLQVANKRSDEHSGGIDRVGIIQNLDIRAEFILLGVGVVDTVPSPAGWLKARSIDRADKDPSAGVSVKNGRYVDHGAGGRSFSLFDLYMERTGATIGQALSHYAAKAGLPGHRDYSDIKVTIGADVAEPASNPPNKSPVASEDDHGSLRRPPWEEIFSPATGRCHHCAAGDPRYNFYFFDDKGDAAPCETPWEFCKSAFRAGFARQNRGNLKGYFLVWFFPIFLGDVLIGGELRFEDAEGRKKTRPLSRHSCENRTAPGSIFGRGERFSPHWHVRGPRYPWPLFVIGGSRDDPTYGEIDESEKVVFVEGLKTAHLLHMATGLTVAAAMGGCKAAHRSVFDMLKPAGEIVFWPDTGEEAFARTAAALADLDAFDAQKNKMPTIRALPAMPHCEAMGADAEQWIIGTAGLDCRKLGVEWRPNFGQEAILEDEFRSALGNAKPLHFNRVEYGAQEVTWADIQSAERRATGWRPPGPSADAVPDLNGDTTKAAPDLSGDTTAAKIEPAPADGDATAAKIEPAPADGDATVAKVEPAPADDNDTPIEGGPELAKPTKGSAEKMGSLNIQWASDITEVPITWVWKPFICDGTSHVIAGPSSVNKSTLMIELTKRMTTGEDWPDGQPGAGPGTVILIGCEDGLSRIVVPRLRVAGANLSKVALFHKYQGPGMAAGTLFDFRDSKHRDRLAKFIEETGDVTAMIVDPITSFMGDGNANSSTEVRQVMDWINDFCDETGVAVLLISHFRKMNNGSIVDSLLGSQAFGAAARIMLTVAKTNHGPEDDLQRVLAIVQSNMSPQGIALDFEILVEDDIVSCNWTTGEPRKVNVDTLLAGNRMKASEVAREFILDVLASGPYPSADLSDQANKRVEFSYRTFTDVKTKMRKEGLIDFARSKRGDFTFLTKDRPADDDEQEASDEPNPNS